MRRASNARVKARRQLCTAAASPEPVGGCGTGSMALGGGRGQGSGWDSRDLFKRTAVLTPSPSRAGEHGCMGRHGGTRAKGWPQNLVGLSSPCLRLEASPRAFWGPREPHQAASGCKRSPNAHRGRRGCTSLFQPRCSNEGLWVQQDEATVLPRDIMAVGIHWAPSGDCKPLAAQLLRHPAIHHHSRCVTRSCPRPGRARNSCEGSGGAGPSPRTAAGASSPALEAEPPARPPGHPTVPKLARAAPARPTSDTGRCSPAAATSPSCSRGSRFSSSRPFPLL